MNKKSGHKKDMKEMMMKKDHHEMPMKKKPLMKKAKGK